MSNSRKASLQQVIENWMTTVLGLLKSGKLRSRRTFDQGDLIKLLAEWYDKFDLITDNILLDGTAQSVRYGEVLRDRSGRLGDINSQEGARAQSFVIGNDETELELSVESRSFVNRVNDQVRKRQKIISNVTGNGEEHSMIWWMFMAVTMEWAIFMGKNFQDNQNSIVNTTDLTLKKMFDISAKLVTEQDEISGLETIGWEKIMDISVINWWWKKHQSSTHKSLRLFRFCIVSLEDSSESAIWRSLEEKDRTSSQSYRDFDGFDGEPTKFEWNIFRGFDTLQLCDKVKSLLSKLGETSENFTGRIIFYFLCRCFNDISCGTKDNEQQSLANARLVSLYVRKFGKGQWFWFRKEEVFYERRQSTRNLGQIGGKDVDWIRRKWMSNFPCYDTCPEVNSKAKDMVNCRFTLQPFRKRLRLFFTWVFLQISSVFTEQWQKCVKYTKPFPTDRGDLMWWWDSQLCSVRTIQKFL